LGVIDSASGSGGNPRSCASMGKMGECDYQTHEREVAKCILAERAKTILNRSVWSDRQRSSHAGASVRMTHLNAHLKIL
jgi:hypothetical protein